jgi:hypothetical protein
LLHGGIPGKAKSEACFAHARSAGNNNQVGALKSAEEFIQTGETRQYIGDGLPGATLCLSSGGGFKVLVQHLADVGEVSRALPVAQPKKQVFGTVEAGVNIRVSLITDFGNLRGGINQVAHYRETIDNLSMSLNVKGGWAGGYQVA